MLDDNRDRDLQRNQLIAILLMTVIVVAWSYFYMPAPPPPVPPAAETPAPVVERPAEIAAPAPAEDGFPALPPVAEAPENPAADDVTIRNERLELTFTRIGARLKQAKVIIGKQGADSVWLVPESAAASDADAVYPLGLRFGSDYLGDALNRRRWEASVDASGRAATFTFEVPGQARVVKSFSLADATRLVDLRVEYTNLEGAPRVLGLDQKEPAFSVVWEPNVSSGDENMGVQQEVVWRKDELNAHFYTASLKPPLQGMAFTELTRAPDFLAIKSAYFVVALRPAFESAFGWIQGAPEPKVFHVGVGAPRVEVPAGETHAAAFQLYLGPTELSSLKEAWPGLDQVLQFFTMSGFGFMDWFAKLLLAILHWFHNNVYANYGVAIIFLTVLVRSVMFPLTLKSMKSMKKMQMLAPEMERVKQECGDNQQEFQKRMMELYRERGVNPLGGCFPILLQMPVFIALYRMLWSAYEMRRAPFLWIDDLSAPDRFFQLPVAIPLPFTQHPLDAINVLPVLMAIAMWGSMKLTPQAGPVQNPQQKMIMNIMPFIFSVICYNMASGLNLYILTSTLLGIAQNYLVRVSESELKSTAKPKAAQRPRHFYAAAQAKKRELAREAKREKRAKPARDDAGARHDKSRRP